MSNESLTPEKLSKQRAKLLALVECAEAIQRLDEWLDGAHPDGGVWLDHVPQSFMDAWGTADVSIKRVLEP